jgi:serine/threonine-protein kinase
MTPEQGLPNVGEVVDGKYLVERELGRGGMGAVFAARHQLTGKQVAIKLLLPDAATRVDVVQRFLREAQAAGRIDHPNVVAVHDVGRHDGSLFIVMEYLTGESLRERIARGAIAAEEALRYFMPVLRGVAAAHAKGVIHRDLKPDNVFLSRSADGAPRDPKVLDFGISKIAESQDDPSKMSLTQTGVVMGTPYYLSPEQIQGAKNVTAASDVYALGVILYEMLTAQVPFQAETYGALLVAILTQEPAPLRIMLPDLDPEFVGVVEHAMHRDVKERFPDVESFALALEPWSSIPFREAGAAGSTTPIGTVSPPPRPLMQTHSKTRSALSHPPIASTPFSTTTETDLPKHANRNLGKLAVGAAVLLLVGGTAVAGLVVIAWSGSRDSTGTGNAAAPNPQTTAPAPTRTVLLVASPPAEVRFGEQVLGRTPYPLVFERPNEGRDVTLRAEGYELLRTTIRADGPPTLTLTLSPTPAPPSGLEPPPAEPIDPRPAPGGTSAPSGNRTPRVRRPPPPQDPAVVRRPVFELAPR